MEGFKKYLIDKGWKPYIRDYKNNGFIEFEVKSGGFSTMGILHQWFFHDDIDINPFMFGLNKKDHPPSFFSPVFDDTDMDKVFEKFTFEEIYNAWLNHTVYKLINKVVASDFLYINDSGITQLKPDSKTK